MFILGVSKCDRISLNFNVPSVVARGLVRVGHHDRIRNERSITDRNRTSHCKSDGSCRGSLFRRSCDRGSCCEFPDVGDRAIVTGCCVWVGRCGICRCDRLCVAVVSEALAVWGVGCGLSLLTCNHPQSQLYRTFEKSSFFNADSVMKKLQTPTSPHWIDTFSRSRLSELICSSKTH